MDNKSRKIYNKVLDYREKGEINKALELCESILAENLREAEILNFKGLMLYEKGMLKDAVTVWKINVDLNNDSMASSYVKDAVYDQDRMRIYKEAEQLLKKSDINNAIPLFLECAKSDFNSIKVNTGLAWCYQKKGDYYRAKEYVDKALKIDKNAVTANEIRRQLDEMDLYYGEKKSSKGKILISIALIAAIIAAVGGYTVMNKNNENNSISTSNTEILNEESKNNSDSEMNEEDNSEEVKEKLEDKFNKESLASAINSSDYNSIYENIRNVKSDELNDEEKLLYDNAVSILKTNGVANFYEYGLQYFNQQDYSKAEDQFNKAYEYCEGNNLEPHIIFYRGSTASEQGNRDLTLQMYERYNDLYPSGPYTEGVLYELALLNVSDDLEKAKAYSDKLVNNYPQSIYINDRIMSIINK